MYCQILSEDMNSSLELSPEESASFKFPFTDKEDADLNLSANYGKVRRSLRLAKNSRDSSSELGLALSPIAKDRESTTSIMGYVEGDSLCLSDIDSEESENDKPQTPSEDFEESRKSMEEQEIHELPEMTIPRTENLEDAMKQVGEHSNDFIGKMRDAANKRKAAVTRSRDFLVAREQEQIRSIAECESRLTTLKEKLESGGETNKENEAFQQIRKKSNNTLNGFGGVGVPKVEKRPTTKPLSPKLGLRRNGGKTKTTKKKKMESSKKISAFKPIAKSNITIFNDAEIDECKHSTSLIDRKKQSKNEAVGSKSKSNAKKEDQELFGAPGGFKARPIPSSTTGRWNAGQLGIPRVSKRALTVPVSPCLGPKRQTRIAVEVGQKTKEKLSKSNKKSNMSERSNGYSSSSRSTTMSPSVQGSPLLGLNLVDSTRKEHAITEARNIDDHVMETRNGFRPFIPRSTSRATMRKQYDDYLGEIRALTIQEKREQLQSQIKSIRRELKILGKELN